MTGNRKGLWIFLFVSIVLVFIGEGAFFALRYQLRTQQTPPEVTIISSEAPASARFHRVNLAVDGLPYRYITFNEMWNLGIYSTRMVMQSGGNKS